MNTVLNSYGQLYGCPEILKKSCKFFCRGLDIRVPKIMITEMLKTILFKKYFILIAQRIRIPRFSVIMAEYKLPFCIIFPPAAIPAFPPDGALPAPDNHTASPVSLLS